MKKSLLTVLCAFFALCALAQNERTYNEQYVYAPEEAANQGNFSNPQDCEITVSYNGDGTANFVFKNFIVNFGGNDMPLGDIVLNNVSVFTLQDGLTYFAQEEATFEGGVLNGIPFEIGGKMNDVKFFAGIEISMSTDQIVYVVIGTDDFGTIPEPKGKVYTETLVVTVNGMSSEPQQTDVTVYDNGDGTINFELKNLVLEQESITMGVGNISLDNLSVEEGSDGLNHFIYDGSLTISAGDKEGVDFWMGPMLGEIPLKLQGKMNEEKLFVTIDIEMNVNGTNQVIHVQLGTDDFPQHKGKVYTETLVVTVNGMSSEPQQTDVTVYDNGDGTINFELKNLVLEQESITMGVGNISLDNLSVEEGSDGLNHFIYDGSLTISAGDKEGVDFWMGPMLGEIPLKLQGKMNEEKLFVTIDIEMNVNGTNQVIHVQLGTDNFAQKTEKTYTEQYVVTVNEEKQEPQTADIKVVDNGDGTIDFVLPEFILHTQFGDFRIGDISLENVPAEEGEDGLVHFSSVEGSTFSVPDENIPEELANMAIFFKNIPYTLEGNFSDEKLNATININVLTFDILVEIGTDFSDDIRGDIDGNGSVNLSDALLILDAMAEGNNDPMYDVDNSGSVNLADFLTVLDIMAEQ